MRVHGGIKAATSADCPEGALDSGGKHLTKPSKVKQECSRVFLMTRVIAHGIIVPLLYTANDARKIIQAAKFPPAGSRGFGS